MRPHGAALLAYFEGDATAVVTIRRDDGFESPVPIAYFFRSAQDFSPIESAAVEACSGHVLDVGAGSGLHSLELTARGLAVTSIDIAPEAVEVMRRRGLDRVLCADVFSFAGGPFDTLLLLGHGISMVESLDGLRLFLEHARELLAPSGQILLDSLDVTKTDDPVHLAYHQANRQAGRPVGMTSLQMEFRGVRGPHFGWLHLDPAALRKEASRLGWHCEVLVEEPGGGYLARLTQEPSPR
jgi:SAM-dependent methyltransferase